MSSPKVAPKPSRDTVQTIHSISKTLGLKFTVEQIESLIGVFELGADPDCVMRFLSENSNSSSSQQVSMEHFTPSTSTTPTTRRYRSTTKSEVCTWNNMKLVTVAVVFLSLTYASLDYDDVENDLKKKLEADESKIRINRSNDFKNKIELEESNIQNIKPDVRAHFLHTMQCTRPSTSWKCKEECYESFTNLTEAFPNKCRMPSPGDTCFGQKFDFAHVENSSRFPAEYQILQYYPRCWAHLAPLICAFHFRPCTKQEVTYRSHDSKQKSTTTGVIEMHAKVRRGYCRETEYRCSEVIQAGYFPAFINCDASSTRNIIPKTTLNGTTIVDPDIFTDSCQISNLPVPFVFEKKCPKPLIYIENEVDGVQPVIDSCYITCRSSHFPENSRVRQNLFQQVLGAGLTLLFISAWVYLHFFSISQIRSLTVFCTSQSFLAISIWTSMWVIGPVLYYESDCIDVGGNNLLRRLEPHTEFLQWCVSQSILMNFSLIAGFQWLAAVTYFGMVCPDWVQVNEKTQRGWNLRSILLFSIYIMAAATSFLWQTLHLHETDGVSGVCVAGLFSSVHYWALISLPAVCTLWIAICMYRYYSLYRYFDNQAKNAALLFVKSSHEYQTDRRKRFCQWQGVDAPTYEDLRNVDDNELEDAEDNGHIDVGDEPIRESIHAEKVKSNHEIGGFVHQIISRFNRADMTKYLTKGLKPTISDHASQNIAEEGIMQYASIFLDKYSRHRIQFYYGFGLSWLLAMSILAIICVWVSIPLHYFLIRGDKNYEVQSIKDYMNCAVNSSINLKLTEWVHSNHPDDAFRHCKLLPYLPKQRSSFIILLYMILPTAPFMVLIASMVAGLCGRGGMKTISHVRWNKRGSCAIQEKQLLNEIEMEEGEKKNLAVTVHSMTDEIDDIVQPSSSSHRSPSHGAQGQDESRPLAANGTLARQNEPSTSREQPANNSDPIEEISVRLQEFVRKFESSAQGIYPTPPMQDVQTLVEDLRAAARRERTLNQHHHIAMEAMRDISAFINYNAERLRADIEMWNLITTTLNQLSVVTNELFPVQQSAEGHRVRRVEPEHARLYEVLLGITQMLTTVNPHLMEFENWRDISDQASQRLRSSVSHIVRGIKVNSAVAPQNPQGAPVNGTRQPSQETSSRDEPNNLYGQSSQNPANQIERPMIASRPPSAADQPAPENVQNSIRHESAANPNLEAVPQNQQVFQQVAGPSHRHVYLNRRVSPPNAFQRQEDESAPNPNPVIGQNALPLRSSALEAVPQNQQVLQQVAGPSHRHVYLNPRVSPPNAFQRQEAVRQQNNQGSAYMESYSAAPNGFITRFTNQELLLRITRMAEIHGAIVYPQEVIYALLMTGDIRLAGNDNPEDGEHVVMPNEYPSLFGRAVPIDVLTAPREFLMAMRRRAIIFVMTLGFDFNRRGRASNSNYMPPTFPDLGMTSMNELLLVRIFGTDNLVRMKALLAELMNRPFLRYSPEIPEIGGFSAYLDNFATLRGFPHHREEWIPDPIHHSSSSSSENIERLGVQEPSISRDTEQDEQNEEDEEQQQQRENNVDAEPTDESVDAPSEDPGHV